MLDDDRYGLTMRVDLEKSVANSLRDNMDVQVRFFTRNTPSGQAFEGVLEERIRILAVRDSTGEDVTGPINPSSAEEEEQAQRTRQRVPTVVVFDADDAQASYLLRAQELGELNILAVSETVEESLDPREDEVVSNAEEVKDFVDEETLTKELEKIEEETNADTGHGEKFMGNAVKLFIDAMTHHLESQFEAGDTFVTLSGEIVVYDEELDELRYFDSRERYLGSKYALQGMSEDEIDEHLNRLTGEDN
nr:RcpC/CpaB family pilus assembly protein [Halalkalibacter oceani]